MSGLGFPGALHSAIKGTQFRSSTDFISPYLFDGRINVAQSQWQAPLFLPNLFPFGSFSTQKHDMHGNQKFFAPRSMPNYSELTKQHGDPILGDLLQTTKAKKTDHKVSKHPKNSEGTRNTISCTICDLNKSPDCSDYSASGVNCQKSSLKNDKSGTISKLANYQLESRHNEISPRFNGVKGNSVMWPSPAANLFGSYPWMALSQLMISSQLMANKINLCGNTKNMTPPKDQSSAIKRSWNDCLDFGKQLSGIPSPTNSCFAQCAKRPRMEFEHFINLNKTNDLLQRFSTGSKTINPLSTIQNHNGITNNENSMLFNANAKMSLPHTNILNDEVELPEKEVIADDIPNLTASKLVNDKFCNRRLRNTFEEKSSSNCQPASIGKEKKAHRCMYCGKLYSRKYGLKIHIRTHTGYKPLKCKVCGRPFGDPSNLNKHVRLHAEGETPYRCEFCGKVLVRRRDLERHIKSRHPERCHPLYTETDILCPPADPRLWTKT